MATRLFEVDGGFSDGKIHYLSGSGVPGGDSSFQDDAPLGSQYVDNSVTPAVHYQKVDTTNTTADWALLLKSDRVSKVFTQSGHTFSVGDWVYRDSGGTFVLGQANDPATADIIGVVESVDGDDFTLVSHGFSDVTSGETEGSALFLSGDTAGAATITKPSSGVQKNLGFVVGGKVFVETGISVEISTTEAPAVPLILTENITTQTSAAILETDKDDGAMWVVIATSANGREMVTVSATHDGIGSAASDANFSLGQKLKAGSNINGLSIGASLNGTYPDQTLDLTVVSTDEVDVALRQIKV